MMNILKQQKQSILQKMIKIEGKIMGPKGFDPLTFGLEVQHAIHAAP